MECIAANYNRRLTCLTLLCLMALNACQKVGGSYGVSLVDDPVPFSIDNTCREPTPSKLDDSLNWNRNLSGNFSDPSNWMTLVAPDSSDAVTFNQYGIFIVNMAGTHSLSDLTIKQGRISFSNGGLPSTLNISGNLVVGFTLPCGCEKAIVPTATGTQTLTPLNVTGSQTLNSLTIAAGGTVIFTSGVPDQGSISGATYSKDACVPSTPYPLPNVSVPSGMSFTSADLKGTLNIPAGMTINVGGQVILEKGAKLLLDGGTLNAVGGIVVDGANIYSNVNQIISSPVSILANGANLNVKSNTTLTLTNSFSQEANSTINHIDKGTIVLKGPQSRMANSKYVMRNGNLDLYTDVGEDEGNLSLTVGQTGLTPTVVTGTVTIRSPQHFENLVMQGRSSVQVLPNGENTLVAKSVSFPVTNTFAANASKLYLNDNALIVQYPTIASPLPTLAGYLSATRIVGSGIAQAIDLPWVVPDVTQYDSNVLDDHSILINYTAQ